MARRIGDLPRGAEATLAALREAGIDPGSVDWERSLAINYAVLVGHGARMIDVGGKKGRHARIFCDKLAAQRIVIFEPNPRMIEILRERFTSMNVSIVPKAVGETPGRFEFLVNRENPGRSGFRARREDQGRSWLERAEVEVVRLDDCSELGNVNYIKIDVEGADLNVLRGARAVLARSRPVVSVEYGWGCYSLYGFRPESLYEFSRELGYTICDLFGNPFEGCKQWLACIDSFYWDYVLLPDERLPATKGNRDRIRRLVARDLAKQQWLHKVVNRLPLLEGWARRRLREQHLPRQILASSCGADRAE
jgi:FkbM family methyltransferase